MKNAVIHWPVAFSNSTEPGKNFFPQSKEGWVDLDTETSLVETWKALIDLQKTGKVKAIGVSNFTVEDLKEVIDGAKVIPAVNQVCTSVASRTSRPANHPPHSIDRASPLRLESG